MTIDEHIAGTKIFALALLKTDSASTKLKRAAFDLDLAIRKVEIAVLEMKLGVDVSNSQENMLMSIIGRG